MKNQKGYFQLNFGTFMIVATVIIGVLGWALIETLLWLFSFVTISFGKD